MKFFTRFLFPLTILIAGVWFLLEYRHTSSHIHYVAWPVAMLSIPFAWAVFIYAFQAIKPGSLKTNLRFWYWRSYLQLADEMTMDSNHERIKNFLLAVMMFWAFGSILAVLVVEKRYFDRHMAEHSVSTRGVVLNYIPHNYRRKHSAPSRAFVQFVNDKGEIQLYWVTHLLGV